MIGGRVALSLGRHMRARGSALRKALLSVHSDHSSYNVLLWQRSAVTGIEDEFEQSSLYLHSLFSLQVGVSRLAVNPAKIGDSTRTCGKYSNPSHVTSWT